MRKEDSGRDACESVEPASKAAEEQRMRWTASNIVATYSNTFEISGAREEIVLSFGQDPAPERDEREHRISLTDRIMMSPFTAKQLVMLLNLAIQSYESSYGPLEAEPPRESAEAPAHAPKVLDKASFLLQRIRDLGVPYGHERSFKMSERKILANRFLLGVNKSDIPPETLFDICGHMALPGKYAADLEAGLSEANIILFGFEENKERCVYKVYLEYWDKIKEEVRKNPRKIDPMLMYLGFKWDALDNARCALARYTCYPLLSLTGILKRLSAIYQGHGDPTAFETAKAIITHASKIVPKELFIYLEVSEEGNPRKSFDINLYKAGLLVKEFYPFLSKIRHHYAIPSEEFDRVYEETSDRVFGHLSGGIDREGKDFLTTYYEIQAL